MFFVEAVGGVPVYRALENVGKPPSSSLQIIDGTRKSGLKRRTSNAFGTGFVEEDFYIAKCYCGFYVSYI
jgi:hypothetical protein